MAVQAEAQAERAEQEVFSFQAEAVQILDLMVHSLSSNKEIFLRELISNASDAIDRLRLELLPRAELPEAEGPLQIRVSHDKDAGTITVTDNGIGMSRHEVIQNIGTIAKSGTREFLRSLTGDQRKDAAMIGQFGVGFSCATHRCATSATRECYGYCTSTRSAWCNCRTWPRPCPRIASASSCGSPASTPRCGTTSPGNWTGGRGSSIRR